MIRLFVMDVDGTLTDGGVSFDVSGTEAKRYHIQDGMGIKLLQAMGVKVAFLSGRHSDSTSARARDLGVDLCVQGVSRKLPVLESWAEEMGISSRQVAYMGDDLPDIECLRWCGFGVVPCDGRPEALREADYVTPSRSGFGAVRDACDRIILMNQREEEGRHRV
ncbi:MAG: HAD-IIIA family hydrolase [Thermanaerothrix sp.]|nr:HAD-IIIA family hydrolase [Thermanaerothrix sp.]